MATAASEAALALESSPVRCAQGWPLWQTEARLKILHAGNNVHRQAGILTPHNHYFLQSFTGWLRMWSDSRALAHMCMAKLAKVEAIRECSPVRPTRWTYSSWWLGVS